MSNMNSNMKKMGRGLAKVANQKSSAKVPMKYATGGVIPKLAAMGSMAPGIEGKTPSGGGKARGGGKATKGTNFRGSF